MNSIGTSQAPLRTGDQDRALGRGVVNRRVVLKRIPEGEPKPSDFEMVTAKKGEQQ